MAVFGSGVLHVTRDAGRTGIATGYGEIGDIVVFGDGSHAAFLHSGGGVLCIPLADPAGVEVLASGFPQQMFTVGGPGGLGHGAGGRIWGQFWSNAAYERNPADGRWRRRILPIYRPTVFAASSGTPGLLVAYGARGPSSADRRDVLVSEDGGTSWSPVPYSERVSEIHAAPWAGDELVARSFSANSLLTGILPDGLWSPVSPAQDPAVRKIVTHPQVPLVACLADSGYHAWAGAASGWSYTGTDTLEVTDLLLAPWIEPPVLVLADEALHYRTRDGSSAAPAGPAAAGGSGRLVPAGLARTRAVLLVPLRGRVVAGAPGRHGIPPVRGRGEVDRPGRGRVRDRRVGRSWAGVRVRGGRSDGRRSALMP